MPRRANTEEPEPSAGNLDSEAEAVKLLMRQAGLAGTLQPGERQSLLQEAGRGDRASHDRLVAAHLPLVVRLASARVERGLSVPDLVQEGSIGLVEAVRSFAGSGEADFASFAEARIGAQMDQAIAAEEAAVRDAELLVAAATDYERVEVLMRATLHRVPTSSELAEKLEWTLDRTQYVAQVVAEARRRHDEELLGFIDPDSVDLDGDDDDERAEA